MPFFLFLDEIKESLLIFSNEAVSAALRWARATWRYIIEIYGGVESVESSKQK